MNKPSNEQIAKLMHNYRFYNSPFTILIVMALTTITELAVGFTIKNVLISLLFNDIACYSFYLYYYYQVRKLNQTKPTK